MPGSLKNGISPVFNAVLNRWGACTRTKHCEIRCWTDSYRVKIYNYWGQIRVSVLLAGHTDSAAFSVMGHHFMTLTGKSSSDVSSQCFPQGISLRFLESSCSKSKLLAPCISPRCWKASSLHSPRLIPPAADTKERVQKCNTLLKRNPEFLSRNERQQLLWEISMAHLIVINSYNLIFRHIHFPT